MHQTLENSELSLEKQDRMLDKQDQSLQLQHTMLEKQDQSLQIGIETKEEVTGLRKDTGKYLDDEFKEIKKGTRLYQGCPCPGRYPGIDPIFFCSGLPPSPVWCENPAPKTLRVYSRSLPCGELVLRVS